MPIVLRVVLIGLWLVAWAASASAQFAQPTGCPAGDNGAACLGTGGSPNETVIVVDGVTRMRFSRSGVILLPDSSSTLQLPSGSVSAPSLTFNGDTNTGIYRPAADNLGIATAGTLQQLTVDNGTFFRGAIGQGSTAASAVAGSSYRVINTVNSVGDNVATAVFTVTVPNANHAAMVKVTILSSNGSTDAFESSRTAQGAIVLARTTGVTTVVTAATLTLADIATVAGGATHTLAYSVSSVSGAAGATQTFTINVTIDDSGNTAANSVVVLAELINSQATGVTIAGI